MNPSEIIEEAVMVGQIGLVQMILQFICKSYMPVHDDACMYVV